jgi:hypothetical protein
MARRSVKATTADPRHARLFALIHQQARADHIRHQQGKPPAHAAAAMAQAALLIRAERSFIRPRRD